MQRREFLQRGLLLGTAGLLSNVGFADETRAAGDRMVLTFRGIEYPFRWCPPGTFMRGSPENEKWRGLDETLHQVTLTRGFWMLEMQVTQAMWLSTVGREPSAFLGMDLPVERVSWDHCNAFVRRFNELNTAPAGYRFALPTEAQWEYACRAGTTTPFHFGSALNGDMANCNGLFPYDTSVRGTFLGRTTKAGTYPPNAWGLYDMHGNVWEFCSDRYDSYPPGDLIDPQGQVTPSAHYVLRGGSWYVGARFCRSAARHRDVSNHQHGDFGLRLVLIHPRTD